MLLFGSSRIFGTLTLQPDIHLEDDLLPNVVLQANFAVDEDILHSLKLGGHPNMQDLVGPLSAHNAIKSVVERFNLLVSFLQEFLATRLILVLGVTFD